MSVLDLCATDGGCSFQAERLDADSVLATDSRLWVAAREPVRRHVTSRERCSIQKLGANTLTYWIIRRKQRVSLTSYCFSG